MISSVYIACTICLEKKENPISLLCGHTFHLECIQKVVNNSCPNCRQNFQNDHIINLHISTILDSQQDQLIKISAENEKLKEENKLMLIKEKEAYIKVKTLSQRNMLANQAMLYLKEQIKGFTETKKQIASLEQENLNLKRHNKYWEKSFEIMKISPTKLKKEFDNHFNTIPIEMDLISNYHVANIALIEKIIRLNRNQDEKVDILNNKIKKLKRLVNIQKTPCSSDINQQMARNNQSPKFILSKIKSTENYQPDLKNKLQQFAKPNHENMCSVIYNDNIDLVNERQNMNKENIPFLMISNSRKTVKMDKKYFYRSNSFNSTFGFPQKL
ncbi:unnamed protein product [Gordionus sp. m RMFG-2023]|uniref:E3 ubiquitin-protein ligase TRIM21-like n=1 Tax=Gordionus sp. m RMFG-2023 TaxID=3053472 RepID=UPI0030E239DF